MPPSIFLTGQWKHLAMLNYEIEPDVLRPYVPRGTELDSWNGKTFVSVVGFMFLRTRVLGLRLPFHHSFEEVNLRMYVRRKASEGWRRGVVFIKEIVPRRAIAAVARIVYNENYVAMPMRHRVEVDDGGGVVEYGWRYRGRWNRLRVTATGAAQPSAEGSEEEFITEHYWGYAAQPRGGAMEYQVEHPRWVVWQAGSRSLDCDVGAIYGERFSGALTAEPSSAFLALGSEIVVRRGSRLP
jgi:uncharacterized protein YqjF (DUF2071 family)